MLAAIAAAQSSTPYKHKIETYRPKDADRCVFALRIEQPFLAEEFEKSNFLRVRALTPNIRLIYPRAARFSQKHCDFYGWISGDAPGRLALDYEVVTEGPDGGRQINVLSSEIEIKPRLEAGGVSGLLQQWAMQQNGYFLERLRLYPNDSFLQYAVMQGAARHGIPPTTLAWTDEQSARAEADLFSILGGGLALQPALQRQTLLGNTKPESPSVHIREVEPLRAGPRQSWAERLRARREGAGPLPEPPTLAAVVPADQYIAVMRSSRTLEQLLPVGSDWGGGLLQLAVVRGQDSELLPRLERQLCLSLEALGAMCDAGIVAQVAITGSDPPLSEGADVALVLELARPEDFDAAAARWHDEAGATDPSVEKRQFRHRGYTVRAAYTADRRISSFFVRHEKLALLSNSHVGIRRLIETLRGDRPRLADEPDLRYMTARFPPLGQEGTGYFYASERFLLRLLGPEVRIAERRRRQCHNHMTMIGHAAQFFRLENDRGAGSIGELAQLGYLTMDKLACPHGGSYSLDAQLEIGVCSLHNRPAFLTPTAESEVLTVTPAERDEYARFRGQVSGYWRDERDPIAARWEGGRGLEIETCALPTPPGGAYATLRSLMTGKAAPLHPTPTAPDTIATLWLSPGRAKIGEYLRAIPGVPEALADDPTLTDLQWLGDAVALHVRDGQPILEVDALHLQPLRVFIDIPMSWQLGAASTLVSASMPAYTAVSIEEPEKARRLLEALATRIPQQQRAWLGLRSSLDAYRLPDHGGHTCYVLSLRVHALKLRLHVSLLGDWLIAATTADTLRDVIDAAGKAEGGAAPATGSAHAMLRLNLQAAARFRESAALYSAERARLACHDNIAPLETLARLHDADIPAILALAQRASGVRYVCPDRGHYAWDAQREALVCGVHGNRQASRQGAVKGQDAPIDRLFDGLSAVTATLRFEDEALIARMRFERRE